MNYRGTTRELLAHLADYWVVRELCFVESSEQIRESLRNFNREATQFLNLSLRAFKYWVYDPLSGTFGPNKFVGFQGMTFSKYRLAGEVSATELDRGRFNGYRARKAIRRALGVDYEADIELCGALEEWAESLFGIPSVFSGRNRAKWKFVRLD